MITGVAFMLLGADCTDDPPLHPTLKATEVRNGSGVLTAVTLDGKGFTHDGIVRVSYFADSQQGGAFVVSPPAAPARDVKANSKGEFQIQGNMTAGCLSLIRDHPDNVGRAYWVSAIATDQTKFKAGVAEFRRRSAPDCAPRD